MFEACLTCLFLFLGDVLFHTGDFTQKGDPEKCARFCDWLSSLPYTHKVVIAGNHDACTDAAFCSQDIYSSSVQKLRGCCSYLENSSTTIPTSPHPPSSQLTPTLASALAHTPHTPTTAIHTTTAPQDLNQEQKAPTTDKTLSEKRVEIYGSPLTCWPPRSDAKVQHSCLLSLSLSALRTSLLLACCFNMYTTICTRIETTLGARSNTWCRVPWHCQQNPRHCRHSHDSHPAPWEKRWKDW